MADLLRVSIIGAMPSGEEWSINPVWSIGGDFGAPVSASQAKTIADAIALITVPAGLTAQMTSGVNVQGCRVEARDVNGILEAQAEGIKGTPTPGTSSAPKSFQSAWVVSLRTATAGASGRGRLYWPATGSPISSSTLRPTSADVTAFLTGAKSYLTAIEAAIDVTLDGVSLAVWSRTRNDLFRVTSIQAGDVLDVQRRRRDQLIESYTTLAYP